jgi:hypothetical protein
MAAVSCDISGSSAEAIAADLQPPNLAIARQFAAVPSVAEDTSVEFSPALQKCSSRKR